MLTQGDIVANSLADYLHRHQEINEQIARDGKLAFYTTDSAEDFDSHAAVFMAVP